MNKIESIVDALSKHELSKHDAVNMIRSLFNEQRRKESIEFTVEKVSFSIENNHGYINAVIPYGYNKIEGMIEKGCKIDVSVVY
ncbi:MAG TPA: hypothetical protein VN726_06410 [Hanamia sp.]|nr:hypothetical protein [Hanamia sp.]